VVELIVANEVESITIRDCGLEVGSVVFVTGGKITSDGNNFDLSDSLSMKILARIRSTGD